ncbi:uncharacterized protein LOC114728497 [Neltuma alba]|uniref:uncharacterized protein LOC114728497 n=1 Tax=Neltuma alba TaxID=207710 RepID=UPI0010A32FCD|nr:uncharacterized protein LOC114728497 [Prosopis alba]
MEIVNNPNGGDDRGGNGHNGEHNIVGENNGGDDPYNHLKSLSMVCSSMKPVEASLDEVLWKNNLRKAFLEKYFPTFNTVINPKSLNAITLRSGKKISAKKVQFKDDEEDGEPIDEEIKVESPPSKTTQDIPKATQETSIQSKGAKDKRLLEQSFKQSLAQEKREFDAAKQRPIKGSPSKGDEKMPKCDKFLKDLCANKRKYRHSERIQLGSSVSAIFKPQLLIKYKDPGPYTIPYSISKTNISHTLLDLGAAINIMPTYIYESLDIHALKDTSVMLRLADSIVRHPKGFFEDVLVQVKGLMFPTNFYVLDMIDSRKTFS